MTQKTYQSEELEVVFSCGWEQCDYGVPGSPVWWEPVDIVVDHVAILGVDVEYGSLPKKLQEEINNLQYFVEFELE